MKLLPKLLAATSIFAATAAIAGPPVTVTFKNNNTTTDATYAIVTSNESSTYANASPKPHHVCNYAGKCHAALA